MPPPPTPELTPQGQEPQCHTSVASTHALATPHPEPRIRPSVLVKKCGCAWGGVGVLAQRSWSALSGTPMSSCCLHAMRSASRTNARVLADLDALHLHTPNSMPVLRRTHCSSASILPPQSRFWLFLGSLVDAFMDLGAHVEVPASLLEALLHEFPQWRTEELPALDSLKKILVTTRSQSTSPTLANGGAATSGGSSTREVDAEANSDDGDDGDDRDDGESQNGDLNALQL
ncbi:hypothetical protein C8J57DRAFT_1517608 [Mycena rebaudengoi]|nr:hypothetical protein C8J57DRAFT_1517608 [Mycena rebaudengoi]